MTQATKNKKIQVNVDRDTAKQAEDIMNEIGVTPTVVINSLYKQIVATGKIPLSFSLTSRQKADFDLEMASKKVPVHKMTKKDIEDFFKDED